MKKISCSLRYLSYPINVTKVHIFYNGFMNFAIFQNFFILPSMWPLSFIYFVFKLCYHKTNFKPETRKIYESK